MGSDGGLNRKLWGTGVKITLGLAFLNERIIFEHEY